jgi:hypothetical protein
MFFLRSISAVAFVLGGAAFATQGCGADDASSSSGSQAGDAGPTTRDGSPKAPSSCGAGGPRYVRVSGSASGGEVVAFADCLDAGTIPPIAKEGDCRLDVPGLFDVARATRSYIAHGTVQATQAASGLAVEVASSEVRSRFEGKITAGQPVRFALAESADYDAVALDVVAPSPVAFTVAAGATRAKGIELTWQGGKSGETLELALEADPGGAGRVLRCRVDAAKGQLTVAPSLLTEWPSGEFLVEVTTVAEAASADERTTAWVSARGAATGASTVVF